MKSSKRQSSDAATTQGSAASSRSRGAGRAKGSAESKDGGADADGGDDTDTPSASQVVKSVASSYESFASADARGDLEWLPNRKLHYAKEKLHQVGGVVAIVRSINAAVLLMVCMSCEAWHWHGFDAPARLEWFVVCLLLSVVRWGWRVGVRRLTRLMLVRVLLDLATRATQPTSCGKSSETVPIRPSGALPSRSRAASPVETVVLTSASALRRCVWHGRVLRVVRVLMYVCLVCSLVCGILRFAGLTCACVRAWIVRPGRLLRLDRSAGGVPG